MSRYDHLAPIDQFEPAVSYSSGRDCLNGTNGEDVESPVWLIVRAKRSNDPPARHHRLFLAYHRPGEGFFQSDNFAYGGGHLTDVTHFMITEIQRK